MAVKTDLEKESLTPEVLKQAIVQTRRDVPMGFGHQNTDKHRQDAEKLLEEYLACCTRAGVAADEEIKLEAIYSQLGTLGGGKLIASRPRV
jgi:RNA-splicing ligase RtcB